MSNKKGFFKKTKARQLALQALYSWLMSNNSLIDIEMYFLSQNDKRDFDSEYFHLLLHEKPHHFIPHSQVRQVTGPERCREWMVQDGRLQCNFV